MKSSSTSFLDHIKEQLDPLSFSIANQLSKTFAVPPNGIGMIALTQELKTDLAMLAKTLPDFQLPPWVEDISVLGKKLATIFNTDPVRDNSALQELARQPLQEFLSQCGKRIPPENARRLRAVRGLLSLELLAHRGQIPTGLARECARWFIGGFPQQVADFRLNSVDLSRIAARSELSSDTVKLLNHLISANLNNHLYIE